MLNQVWQTAMSNKYGSLNIGLNFTRPIITRKRLFFFGGRRTKSVNRVLPQLKEVDLQTVLASNKTLFDGYTQTLEPSCSISVSTIHKDQSNIGSKRYKIITLVLVMILR